jgi:tetratricopeptide (TPR) repeat protein
VSVLDSTVRSAAGGDGQVGQAAGAVHAFAWRERAAEGSFEAALAAYFAAGPEDAGVQQSLESLCSLVALTRSRAWNRARRQLEAVSERGDWLDWNQLEADLAALQAATEALDSRDSQAAGELLDSVRLACFEAETSNLRGAAAIFEGDFTGASAWFERAITLDPKHYRAVTNMGNAALESGDTDMAIEWYEKALRLNGDFPNAHHNLGVAYRKKGQIAKSIRSLKSGQKAQQRFDQVEAREQLGRIGRGAGQKYTRWLFYAAAGAAVYWFLSSRGMI